MRIVQKCNQAYSLTKWMVVIIGFGLSGCVSQNPPIKGIPVNADLDSAKTTPSGMTTTLTSAEPEDLSAKSVAPVGFKKFMGIFTPYRITIQQGNFVSKEMADEVKPGMTREQVRFLLGTALLTDMFHADRWDYIFRLLKPSGELITSRVTVYFEKSLVAKIERGDLPDEKEYLTRITNAAINNGIEQEKSAETNSGQAKAKNG